MRFWNAAVVGFILFGSSLSAGASELNKVYVIGSKEGLLSVPGSGAYLDQEDIRQQNYDDINRVLYKVPGVYLREEDGYGLFQNISLRGVDPGRSGKVTLMEDGVLSAPAPYSAPSAYYSPTTGRMHAIEVLKGSSQVRFGPHTTGGVVNYISTPIPEDHRVYLKATGAEHEEGRLHSYVGQYKETDNGRFGFLTELYYRRAGGFKRIDETPDFTKGDRTGFERVEPMLKLAYEPNSNAYQRFEAKFGYSDLEAHETYLGLSDADFKLDPNRRYAASRLDNIQTSTYRALLRHTADVADNLSLVTSGYYQHFHRNWFKLHELRGPTQNLAEALADPTGGLRILKGEAAGTLRYRNNNREYYLAGVESVLHYALVVGDTEHNLQTGVRYHQDRVRRRQTNEDFTQDASGVFTARTPGPYGAAGNRKQLTRALSIFVEDEITLGQVTITPGIRWEHIDYEFKDFNAGTSGRSGLDVVSPGVGAQWAVTDQFSLFGGVYKGTSVPGPSANINSAIREETSLGTEMGARWQHPRGIKAEAVFFATDFNDLVVADNIGGGGTGVTENVGDVKVFGGEFLLGFDPGSWFEWPLQLPLYAGLTLTNAELDGPSNSTDPESIFSGGRDGNKVPYVPEVQFSVGAAAEWKRFRIALDGVYVGETYSTASNSDVAVNPNNGTPDARFGKTDDRFVVDLMASYRLSENAKFFAGAHNIFNQKYVVSRHPYGPRPGMPVTAMAGVELVF